MSSTDIEANVDESIEDINRQISEMQEQIKRLAEKKKRLEEQKNKMKELKYLQKSFELSSQDWDKGAIVNINRRSSTLLTPFSLQRPIHGAKA